MTKDKDDLEDESISKDVKHKERLNMEVMKMLLEFMSKAFYPGIAVLLIFLLKPAFSEIDLKTFLDRITSAKIGEYEFTFQQAQDVGANTAPLNNKIAELELSLATLKSDFSNLQKASGLRAIDEQTLKKRELEEKKFRENSQYTVLVFHRTQARAKANKITQALLASGYQSSSTETDFTELRKTHSPGTIYISHSEDGQSIYKNVEELITSLKLEGILKVQDSTTNLRHGEVQVLVF